MLYKLDIAFDEHTCVLNLNVHVCMLTMQI